MKSTLVLGLALAANAMAADQPENELFVAPNGRFDRDLAQRFPGRIMYDEAADDELYHGAPSRENFRSYEEWLRATRKYDADNDDEFLVRPLVPHVSADDEELFVAPQGKLADLSKKYPGMIMFDEQADDELGLKIVHLPVAEHVAYDDDELIYRNKDLFPPDWLNRIAHDDEELFFAPGQKLGNLANARPTVMLDEAADDEFVIMLKPREFFKSDEEYQRYRARANRTYDDAADDELRLVDKDHLLPKEGARRFIPPHFDKETRTWKVGTAQPASFDDDENYVRHKTKEPIVEADDELWVEAADDELAFKFVHLPVIQNVAYDDELMLTSDHASGRFPHPDVRSILPKEHYEKYLKGELLFVFDDELAVKIINLPADENGNVAFDDDELAFIPRAPRVIIDKSLVKPAKSQTSETLVRDDEADDELHYLGQLLKGQIPRPFRGFDDDEFRAKGEKPAHVKGQEMGTEGPKIKRKLRPIANEIPLTEH